MIPLPLKSPKKYKIFLPIKRKNMSKNCNNKKITNVALNEGQG